MAIKDNIGGGNGASSLCVLVKSGVTNLSNFDVNALCNTIRTTYGISVDASRLTNANFVVGNYRSFPVSRCSPHEEGTDHVTPYDVEQGISFSAPTISYDATTKKLSVGNATGVGYARLHRRYEWSYGYNFTYDVYLVLFPQ